MNPLEHAYDSLKVTMTSFMNRGNDVEESTSNPFDETPFEPYNRIHGRNDKEQIATYANNAFRHLKRNETATDDELRNAAIDASRQTLAPAMWTVVAPLLANAETVNWNGGYSLPADAPGHKSDEWREAASQLNIPDTRSYDGVPKAVSSAYHHLEKITIRNGGPRSCHPKELELNARIHLPERRYAKAWDYLADLPGVVSPDEAEPDWEYVDPEAVETTEATDDSEEAHA